MVTVASRKLKNQLGEYLRQVREGQTVRVTNRGKPIACILPLGRPGASESDVLPRLLSSGDLILGTGRLRRRANPAVLGPGASVAEMVARDRR